MNTISFIDTPQKCFSLKGKVNIYKVTEMQKYILENYESQVEKRCDWFIDFSEVVGIDTAALQLFLSFRALVVKNGGKMVVKSKSQVVEQLERSFAINL